MSLIRKHGLRKVTASEFNQNTSAAQRAAQDGPVVVVNREVPTYVLMTYQDYQNIHHASEDAAEPFISLWDAVQPSGGGIDTDLVLPERHRPREIDL